MSEVCLDDRNGGWSTGSTGQRKRLCETRALRAILSLQDRGRSKVQVVTGTSLTLAAADDTGSTWRDEIEKFDYDLKLRMQVIRSFETCQYTEKIEHLRIRSLLGFKIPGAFPYWLDHTKEWRNRNRERVNALGRIQQRNWRLKNLEKARARGRTRWWKDVERSREKKRLSEKRRRQVLSLKRNNFLVDLIVQIFCTENETQETRYSCG